MKPSPVPAYRQQQPHMPGAASKLWNSCLSMARDNSLCSGVEAIVGGSVQSTASSAGKQRFSICAAAETPLPAQAPSHTWPGSISWCWRGKRQERATLRYARLSHPRWC